MILFIFAFYTTGLSFTYYIIEGGKNIAYSIDNKELNNSETGLTTLKILTNNQNVNSITGITIPTSLTGYTLSGSEYSAILGYTKDTLGISIFGNQYLTSNNSLNNNSSSGVITPFVCGDTVSAGGFTYTTKLAVDGKCWTSTNMKHTPTSGASSCYNNDINNCNTYGRLYNWYAASHLSVCPELGTGWTLPTNQQFSNLISSGATGWTGNKLGGLVSFLPGYANNLGVFSNIDNYAFYWTTNQDDINNSFGRYLNYINSTIYTFIYNNNYKVSVICIKN